MEFLNIIGSISIKPKWANITGAVLKAGTPISATGTVANNAAAIGLLAQDAHKGDSEVNVVYAGLVDMNEVKRSYGTLYDNCIAALKGITFINASGSAIVPSELPAVTSDDKDKFLHTNGSTGALEWVEAGGGSGVTTLYFTDSAIYETSGFWTDPSMSDPSTFVSFANALAMVQANPASVLFCSDEYAMPAHARSDGYAIDITMLSAPTQSGLTVYGYHFNAIPDENVKTTIFLPVGS